MNLKEATLKYKVGNSTFYQFKKDNGFTEILEVQKTKAGYNMIFEGENIFKEISGIRTLALVQKELNNIKY